MNKKWSVLFKVSIYTNLLFVAILSTYAQQSDNFATIDVQHYIAQIEPDIVNGSIQGKVSIQFLITDNAHRQIKLDCGDLTIEGVQNGKLDIPFEQRNNSLFLSELQLKDKQIYQVDIAFHGKPRFGINFFPALDQVYTVFSTSQWLVCKDSPDDKATLELSLILPAGLQVISNGNLSKKTLLNNHKINYEWSQKIPAPSYIFGFAAGHFKRFSEQHGKTILLYFAKDHPEEELKQIFIETPAILDFFEDRTGVPYPDSTYAQIIAEGNVSQEMSSFAVLRSDYGKQVLSNAKDVNLLAHELAHQWWGNQVTCLNWNHFWLNEGFAVFMSSAYKEHRFGREEYLKDIEVYFNAYQKVVEKGMDKPLVFPNWTHPTSDDRTIVYYKGAYVLHLLREELGEKEFWNGIKLYTGSNFGKSVITKNLQESMEKSSAKNLNAFFSKWIN